ncbi:MAG: gsiA 1 [Rhodoferax sp.]|nr:gsiA 1 [Rhodoferax sp.]
MNTRDASSAQATTAAMAATATAAPAPVLVIDDLHVALPSGSDRSHAVHGVSLTIMPGKTVCVVGESGSGKSVMATTVMGLLPRELRATQGRIVLQGESLLGASALRLRQLRGKAMGMVFQEPMTALNPVMTCGEQIDELLKAHTAWPAARRQQEILDILAKVRLPEPARMVRSHPHQLSGGQRQRIVIAMAVILKPALLICDEPTTALDVTTQKEILKLIAELQADTADGSPGALQSGVLFITHDMGVVAEIADEVLVMNQGRSVEYGPVAQVLHRPRATYTRMLLDAVPSMTPPPARPAPQGPALLRGEGIGKTYSSRDWLGRARDTHALRDAALAVHAGETLGVVGESGSGKSTLARCLIRLIDPSAGEVFWGDTEVASAPEGRLRPLRSQVQVVFQDPNRSLNPRRKVGDAIIEGAVNFGLGHAEALALAADLMDKVRLPREALQRYPSQFSGGQRQRIAIARALACKPRVLVADEAVSALDVSVQAQILTLLRDIRDELGLGLLFITHDLRVAAQLCDRVIVMHEGRIVEQGATAALYANPQQAYTRRLLQAAPQNL